MRVVRAFFTALWLTLQGKTLEPAPAVSHYPFLDEWVRVGVQRVNTVFRIADKLEMPIDARKAIVLKLEGRPISMETILSAVQHNFEREYPLLLATPLEYTLTTFYALNLNDRYRVGELLKVEAMTNTAVQNAIYALSEHLNNIPSNPTTKPNAE